MALVAGFYTGIQMFDEQVQTAYTLLETYESNIANGNSAGAIVFGSGSQTSTIAEQALWDRLATKTKGRDPTRDQVETVDYLNQYITKTVKHGMLWGPTRLDTSSARWKGVPTDRLGYVRGAQLAAESVNYRAQVAIASLKGVFGLSAFGPVKKDIAIAPAAALPTAAAANKPTLKTLAETQALMGASWNMLRVWLMHGDVFHAILGDNISNAQRLFTIGTIGVYSFLEKRFLVTDNPQLVKPAVTTGNMRHPKEYYTFGLIPGAVSVLSAGEFDSASSKLPGRTNITVTVQEQDSCIVGVRNMQYNKTAAPVNLTDFSNSANWTSDIGTWDKIDYCGVQLISNA